MKVLVTGGAGFIGSNFLHLMVPKHKKYDFVCLDALTYAGNYNNLEPIIKRPNFRFIKGNIVDRGFINDLFAKEKFNWVVNFAAESHNDRSIVHPEIFATTNILGTQTLLDASKKHKVDRYHQISTDEVYGALPLDRPDLLFTEDHALRPTNPYSASKAAADLLVQAYHRTFQLPTTISRCSNNYGPYQFPEKLIPKTISQALSDQPVAVHSQGEHVRDWIHVIDHSSAIEKILLSGKIGAVYNLGGRSEKTNLEIVQIILRQLGKPDSLITYVQDRLGNDLRYAMDSSKIKRELGWNTRYSFENSIRETIDWYQNHPEWLLDILSGKYQNSYIP